MEQISQRWTVFHVCQCVKGIWSMALLIYFNFCPEVLRHLGKMIPVGPFQTQSSLVYSINNKIILIKNKIYKNDKILMKGCHITFIRIARGIGLDIWEHWFEGQKNIEFVFLQWLLVR